MSTAIIFAAVIFLLLVFIFYREKEFTKERKDLLDRIQAPTFAEYTNKVIKEIKADQPPDIKQVDDYIS